MRFRRGSYRRKRPYRMYRRRRIFRRRIWRKNYRKKYSPYNRRRATNCRTTKDISATYPIVLTPSAFGVGTIYNIDFLAQVPAANSFGNRNIGLTRIDLRAFALNFQLVNNSGTPIVFHIALLTPIWGTTQITDVQKQFFRDPSAVDQTSVDFSSTFMIANYNLYNVLPISSTHFIVHFHKRFILQSDTTTATAGDAGRAGTMQWGLLHRYGRLYWRRNQRHFINATQVGKNASPVLVAWCAPMETTSTNATGGITWGYQSRIYFNQN